MVKYSANILTHKYFYPFTLQENKVDSHTLRNLRVDYSLKKFDESDVHPNPMIQFSLWMSEAVEAKVNEPNAMTLATANHSGGVSARIVLLKGYSENGFTFFTNYESTKGNQLAQNPNAALVFCWLELQRQVRVEGIIEKLSHAESDEYFFSRPYGSQLGAHASPQSKPVKSRQEIEELYEKTEKRFTSETMIRPANWGGYILKPKLIEFWQGRQNRLHDRFLFSQSGENWEHKRIAP